MKLVGKQKVDYVSKKTNQPVTGITLHCVGENSRVEGHGVETVFVSEKSPMYGQCLNFPLDADINIGYNRWGSAESITLREKK